MLLLCLCINLYPAGQLPGHPLLVHHGPAVHQRRPLGGVELRVKRRQSGDGFDEPLFDVFARIAFNLAFLGLLF